MHHAVTHVLGVFEARNHTEHALLLGKFQVRLKSYEIKQRFFRVFGAQLHYGPRAVTRAGVA